MGGEEWGMRAASCLNQDVIRIRGPAGRQAGEMQDKAAHNLYYLYLILASCKSWFGQLAVGIEVKSPTGAIAKGTPTILYAENACKNANPQNLKSPIC
jgi:hypothetical protein